MFSCKFAACFQNTLSKEQQWWATSNAIILPNENGNEWKAIFSEHNSIKAVDGFLQQKKWKKTYVEWKQSCDQNQKNKKSIRVYKKPFN